MLRPMRAVLRNGDPNQKVEYAPVTLMGSDAVDAVSDATHDNVKALTEDQDKYLTEQGSSMKNASQEL